MKFHTRKRRMPVVIIVSLIDIFVILLIFVIVTSTFKTQQPSVVIHLPSSKEATAAQHFSKPILVSVTKDEKVKLDGTDVSLKGLKSALQAAMQKNPKRPVALAADEKTPYGFVISVLDSLKEAGVKTDVSALMKAKP